jgi:hypothetical protein
MDAHLDFSIFLIDGSAFGKATYDTSLPHAPSKGDTLLLSDLLARATQQAMDREALAFVESKLGKLSVCDVSALPADSSGPRILVEIGDVVLDSRETAGALVRYLDSFGFDCDVWGTARKP